MANLAAHSNQIERNIDFLTECDSAKCGHTTKYLEWGVVLRFYIAVHIVEAMLCELGVHSESHSDRKMKMTRTAGVFSSKFQKDYFDLYNFSRIARYLTSNGTSVNKTDADDAEKAVKSIRSEARAFFSDKGTLVTDRL